MAAEPVRSSPTSWLGNRQGRGGPAAGDQLEIALGSAPWLDPAVAAGLRQEVAAVRAAAERRATPDELRAAVRTAVADLGVRFGGAGPAPT